MEIILRGVRGSIPAPALEMAFYGGNTSCVEARTENGTLIFFDAGSGLRGAGDSLPDKGECHILITHGHTDHIQGLGFFPPLHSPNWTTYLYVPEWLQNIPDVFFENGMFPVSFKSFKGNVVRVSVAAGERFSLRNAETVRIETFALNHPGRGLGYKIFADGAVFLYGGDHEITDDPVVRTDTALMLQGADLAVVDAMYSRKDYLPGWGHSTWEDWIDVASIAETGQIVFSHHSPTRVDRELDALQLELEKLNQEKTRYYVARESLRFSLPGGEKAAIQYSDWLYSFMDEISRFQDESTILDRILAKAREITMADAGTIFLEDGGELVFAYTHNDSLFSVDSAYKYAYSTFRLPISTASIAGYAAVTGKPLNLADVHFLPEGAPYSFNSGFDESTGYRTCSMLTVPFHDHTGKVLGVIQLINSLDNRTKKPIPFTAAMQSHVNVLAREAAVFLERSTAMRKSIYRILHMAAVHDPIETGPHAERVGAIAAELYQARANKLAVDPDIARYEKDRIRLASMLHDIGKVGISDLLLKKPGKLTDEEFAIMRGHTEIGADILRADEADFAALARDIARHHHQKWNGKGYAGSTNEGILAGEAIPLAARITAIADVFDALVSPRCYKQPWTFEKAMELLRKEAGEHFDPLLVDCMEELADVLRSIYQRFPDNHKDEPPAEG